MKKLFFTLIALVFTANLALAANTKDSLATKAPLNQAELVLLEELNAEATLNIADILADLIPTVQATIVYNSDGEQVLNVKGEAMPEQLPAGAKLLFTSEGINYYSTN